MDTVYGFKENGEKTETLNKSDILSNSVCVSTSRPTNKEKIWIRKSKNLVNPELITLNYGLNGDTGWPYKTLDMDGKRRAMTGIIPVEEETNYIISGCSPKLCVFLDDQDKMIDKVNEQTEIITPKGCKYLRFAFDSDADYSEIQLEKNTIFTGYNAYVDEKIYIYNSNTNEYEEFLRIAARELMRDSFTGYSLASLLSKAEDMKYTQSPAQYEKIMTISRQPDKMVNVDFNDFTDPGIYSMWGGEEGTNSEPLNSPLTITQLNAGVLLVLNYSNVHFFQILFNNSWAGNSNTIFFRSNSNGAWSPWELILDDTLIRGNQLNRYQKDYLYLDSDEELKTWLTSDSAPLGCYNVNIFNRNGSCSGAVIQKTNNLYISYIWWGYNQALVQWRCNNGTWSSFAVVN